MFCDFHAALGAHMRFAAISLKTVSMMDLLQTHYAAWKQGKTEEGQDLIGELSHCRASMIMHEKGKEIGCKGVIRMADHGIQAG